MSPSWPKLTFLELGPPVEHGAWQDLEARLGCSIEPGVKAWLGDHGGGMLGRENYWIAMQAVPGLPCSISVEYLLSIPGIHEALDQFSDAFPPRHLPFAHDGDGNYLLASPSGRVSFWDWQGRIRASSRIDRYTLPLAETFHGFLSLLGPGPLTDYSEK